MQTIIPRHGMWVVAVAYKPDSIASCPQGGKEHKTRNNKMKLAEPPRAAPSTGRDGTPGALARQLDNVIGASKSTGQCMQVLAPLAAAHLSAKEVPMPGVRIAEDVRTELPSALTQSRHWRARGTEAHADANDDKLLSDASFHQAAGGSSLEHATRCVSASALSPRALS